MPPVELHLRLRVPPGGEPTLRAFLAEAIPVYEAPGGIRVRLLQRDDDPYAFIELIEYATEADYGADQRRVAEDPVLKALLARWRALLDGPPTVEVWRAADEPA